MTTPAEQDPVARMLTEVLRSEAAEIEPGDRLDRIREETARPRRRWVPVAAAAAAVVLVGGGVFAAVSRHSGPAHQPAATTITSPTASADPSTPVTPTPSYSPPPPTTPTSPVPVYFLGRNATGLFREFLSSDPPLSCPVNNQSNYCSVRYFLMYDALIHAVDPSSPDRPGDFSPWLRLTEGFVKVTLVGTSEVDVDLPTAETEVNGRTSAQARLAAQQLAWTASATAQNAGLGVRITFGGKPGKLFGSLPTDQVFHRPPSSMAFEDLAAIWVLAPEQGQVVHGRVTVSGEACTFEANVAWELTGGGPTTRGPILRSGHTTATSGCPQRGTWTVTLSGLSPGVYTFRAYEPSEQANGAPAGQDTTTFVIR